MIRYSDLRDKLLAWPKYPECRPVLRAPLITAGFPGTFNMSYTEHHWLQEFGSYTDWNHDYAVSTVQSCVRLNDLDLISSEEGWRYLGVFEMADLNGEIALARKPDYTDALGWQMGELVRFLADFDIPAHRIHASYCAGGDVTSITEGKYRFSFQVPPDETSRQSFLRAGIPERNLIPDHSRDTLLSLHVHRPTPWGFRNEIYIDIGSRGNPVLLDVATSEYLLWNPRFDEEKGGSEGICGLVDIKNGYFGVSFGVERLAMAVNGLSRVHEVDYLQRYYDGLAAVMGRQLEPDDYRAGETLRILHRVLTDREFHPEAAVHVDPNGKKRMGLKRRKKIAALKRRIPHGLPAETLRELLGIHAAAQPWHDRLSETVDTVAREIEEFRLVRTNVPGRHQ